MGKREGEGGSGWDALASAALKLLDGFNAKEEDDDAKDRVSL